DPGRAAGGGPPAQRPVGRGVLRLVPAGVHERHLGPEEDPAVEGGQSAAAQGAVPTHADGGPVQPTARRLLHPPGGRPAAEDAGGRGVHAEARDDLLRGAQEPRPVRPAMGLKNRPLTTRYLVHPALLPVGPLRQDALTRPRPKRLEVTWNTARNPARLSRSS